MGVPAAFFFLGPQILHPSSMIRLSPLPAEAGKLLLWQLRASCLVSALNHTVGCGGLGNQTYVSDTKGVNKPHSQQLSSWAVCITAWEKAGLVVLAFPHPP